MPFQNSTSSPMPNDTAAEEAPKETMPDALLGKNAGSPHKTHTDHACGINAFPTELLLIIFHYSLGSQATAPVHCAPYNLTAVCRRWRQIALDTPELWTELNALWEVDAGRSRVSGLIPSIDNLSAEDQRARERRVSSQFAEALSTWLRRSMGLPLKLTFSIHSHIFLNLPLAVFMPFAWRTRTLNLNAPLSAYANLADVRSRFKFAVYEFPILEDAHLVISRIDINSEDELSGMPPIDLSSCGKLTNLTLLSAPPEDARPAVGFISDGLLSGVPYSQLTSLRVSEVSLQLDWARDLLMQCANLVTCEFTIPRLELMVFADPVDPVTLPHLQTLSMTFIGIDSCEHSGAFFDALTTPQLTTLRIDSCKSQDRTLIPALTSMQQRSNMSLRSLQLKSLWIPYDVILPLLEVVPTLTELSIEAHDGNFCGYNRILNDMLAKPGRHATPAKIVLPKLETISLTDNVPKFDPETMAREADWRYLSDELYDYTMLDVIVSRGMARETVAETGDANAEDETIVTQLRKATIRWKNVPNEWRELERTALKLVEKVQERHGVVVNLSPLEFAMPEESIV